MAYPFTRALSFGQFRERLEKEFNCEFKEEPLIINDKGKSDLIYYFQRTVDNKVLRCSLFIKSQNDMCQFSFVRYVCKSLQIPPKEFGLVLNHFRIISEY